ncbi:hypothetical protein [Streptomyces sp. NPDC088733]|uniref:hypothetical protein n=1 Tax=Streptomyces sp. NPDC088733 TaxID=3365880 RepID=UPI003809D268
MHDAVLPWWQINAVSLWYEQPADSDTTPPKPRLRLWTAPGVTLPRKQDRGRDALDRYTLLNCADLDQHVGHLRDALASYAGDRFETAPRAVRPPIPVTVAGPELSVPGGERTFTADLGEGPRTRVWTMWALLFSAVFVSVYALVFVYSDRLDSDSGIGIPVTVSLLGMVVCWTQVRQYSVRRRKPMELRIGAAVIAMREVADEGRFFRWSDIATVTVGRQPYSLAPHPCLTVRPLPDAHVAGRDRGGPGGGEAHRAPGQGELRVLPGRFARRPGAERHCRQDPLLTVVREKSCRVGAFEDETDRSRLTAGGLGDPGQSAGAPRPRPRRCPDPDRRRRTGRCCRLRPPHRGGVQGR